ncbi:ATP-dependent DNA helicase Rep [Pseudoclavibacter triregionum]|nr:ATP-dependent DNA helicase Rep [Pseudoclavibacter triregionum]
MSEAPATVAPMNEMRDPAGPDGAPALELDPSQRAVVDAVLERRSAAVLGAPGSGRTTALVEAVAALLDRGVASDELLVLAPDRRSASRLRDRIAARIAAPTTSGALGRTPQSAAFAIVRADRERSGEEPPSFVTGPDEEAMLSELLAFEREQGRDLWPDPVTPEMLDLAGFRAELRSILAVAADHDVSPEELEALAEAARMPVWRAVARVLRARLELAATSGSGAFTTPELLLEAVSVLYERAEAAAAGETPAPGAFDRVRWVLVDDAQELAEPARALLEALEACGAAVVTFGDPDAAMGGFHGGRPEHAVSWRREGRDPERIVLERVHRQGPELRAAASAIAERIAATRAAEHRLAPAARDAALGSTARDAEAIGAVTGWRAPEPIMRSIAASPVEEAERIAAYLRELHLAAGVPWREMAVVVRSGAQIAPLERLLARYDVPARTDRPPRAVDDPTVAAIVRLAWIAIGEEELTAEAVEELARSPLFGADSGQLRRVRKALRFEERAALAGEGEAEAEAGAPAGSAAVAAARGRSSDELLVEAVSAIGGLATLGDPDSAPLALTAMRAFEASRTLGRDRGVIALRRLGECLRAARETAMTGGAADEVMWAIWETAKVAKDWREAALGEGPAAIRANSRLDAVVALFDTAKRVVEREPDSHPSAFLEQWMSRSVMADSLGRQVEAEGVVLGTPPAVLGREFRVVVVPGLNEGAWPNPRLRDSLLGAGLLADLLRGREGVLPNPDDPVAVAESMRARRREVLSDELRLLLQAITRASEHVLLTAVRGEDESPSRVLEWLDLPGDDWTSKLPPGSVSLRRLVAELRRSGAASEAAGRVGSPESLALARLALAGAPGADPDAWLGLDDLSTTAPVLRERRPAPGEEPSESGPAYELPVSPSGVEAFEKCPVAWFVERHGGGSTSAAMGLGTIVHAAAELDFPDAAERLEWVREQAMSVEAEAEWDRTRLLERAAHLSGTLSTYLVDAKQEGWRVIGAERAFRMPLPPLPAEALELPDEPEEAAKAPAMARISWPVGEAALPVVNGKIDRIEEGRDGALRVVDFKTGKSPISIDDATRNAQLAAYRLAIAEGAVQEHEPPEGLDPSGPGSVDPGGDIPQYQPVDGAQLVYLGTPKPTPRRQEGGDDGLARARERLARIAHGMAGIDVEALERLVEDGLDGEALEEAIRAALDRAVLRFHPDTCCEKSHGSSGACSIHRIPEVTQ